jgi:hypothetical protein
MNMGIGTHTGCNARIQGLEQELARERDIVAGLKELVSENDRLSKGTISKLESRIYELLEAKEQAEKSAADLERRLKEKENIVSPVEARALQVSHDTLTGENNRFREMNEALKKAFTDALKKLDAVTAERDGLRAVLEKIRDQKNWGYFDDSGCPKGAGVYYESWIAESHPIMLADKALQSPPAPLPQRHEEYLCQFEHTTPQEGCECAKPPDSLPQRQDGWKDKLKPLWDELSALLSDEDLDDEKLREASEGLLPRIHDALLPIFGDAAPQRQDSGETGFPNPLQVNFGEGRMVIAKFNSPEGRGIYIKDSGESHQIGSSANEPPKSNHIPEKGEIYLLFAKVESAKVFSEELSELIAEWPAASGAGEAKP